ncbi:MAG TPA: metallophosphoesterase family protein [Pedomonas sp.]|uniref:metallophosphoesterase family protein n=1 Tax=Pedomonas sp. TaxID=2976421 RepID=UPI002F3F6121
MIRRLLSRIANRSETDFTDPEAPAFTHAATPAGVRLIAVGDIHGHLDLAHDLMARLEDEHATASGPTHLIFLGDYVDRGPASAQVIDWLAGFAPGWATPHFLRGNHEQCLIDILSGAAPDDMLATWLDYGGRETLSSYGLGSRVLYSGDLEEIRAAIRQAIPPHHRRFLEATLPCLRFGDYLFAHAGIRPGVPVETQSEEDLFWIREPFLSSSDDFGAVVVHGHTITPVPENRHNRIGIDTGVYRHGVLTAVVLEGTSRRFVAAQASGVEAGQPAHQVGG